jgi:hypothetical protein
MQKRRALFRRRTPGVEPQEPIVDPRGELDDLTGHPVARGCKECRRYDQDCSMTSTGELPCAQCVQDGTDCQPIVESQTHVKGPCALCEQRGIQCSFEHSALDSICDQCLDDDNLDCAPRSSYSVDRADLDRILYGPNRKYPNCTYCRTHKKRCSLKKKEDKPPCKYCKKHGIGCTFYDALPPATPKKAKGKQKQKEPPEVSVPDSGFFDPEDLMDLNEDTPEIEIEDAEGRRGIMTKIQTSFAHPIKFYAIENDAPDCNFCELPVFGFVGHFEKTIHAIKWHNGTGYTEIAAGHREENGATTMCQICVMERVQIIYCENHRLGRCRQFQDSLDFDTAAEELMATPPCSDERRLQIRRWCSMCFNLAAFMCCNEQPALLLGQGEEDTVLEGCGLRLCERCEQRFRGDFGGDSDEMARFMEGEPKQVEGEDEIAGARADVGFLSKDGLLIRNVEVAIAGT